MADGNTVFMPDGSVVKLPERIGDPADTDIDDHDEQDQGPAEQKQNLAQSHNEQDQGPAAKKKKKTRTRSNNKPPQKSNKAPMPAFKPYNILIHDAALNLTNFRRLRFLAAGGVTMVEDLRNKLAANGNPPASSISTQRPEPFDETTSLQWHLGQKRVHGLEDVDSFIRKCVGQDWFVGTAFGYDVSSEDLETLKSLEQDAIKLGFLWKESEKSRGVFAFNPRAYAYFNAVKQDYKAEGTTFGGETTKLMDQMMEKKGIEPILVSDSNEVKKQKSKAIREMPYDEGKKYLIRHLTIPHDVEADGYDGAINKHIYQINNNPEHRFDRPGDVLRADPSVVFTRPHPTELASRPTSAAQLDELPADRKRPASAMQDDSATGQSNQSDGEHNPFQRVGVVYSTPQNLSDAPDLPQRPAARSNDFPTTSTQQPPKRLRPLIKAARELELIEGEVSSLFRPDANHALGDLSKYTNFPVQLPPAGLDYSLHPSWSPLTGSSPTPWMQVMSSYPSARESLEFLNQEILAFYDYVKPTEYEVHMRDLIKNATAMILNLDNDTKLVDFGSTAFGHFLPTADLDLVVVTKQMLDGTATYMEDKKACKAQVFRAASLIEQAGFGKNVKRIGRARVPITKFKHKETDIDVDISFYNPSGLHANKLYQDWLLQYPEFAKLLLLVKQFIKMRDMDDPSSGGFGGFTISCMVIHMLQREITWYSPLDGHTSSTYHARFLLEFARYYSELDQTKTVITVGENTSKMSREVYKARVGKNPSPKFDKSNHLTVANPLDFTADVAGATDQFPMLATLLKSAHEKLDIAVRRASWNGVDRATGILGIVLRGNYASYDSAREKFRRLGGEVWVPPLEQRRQVLRSLLASMRDEADDLPFDD